MISGPGNNKGRNFVLNSDGTLSVKPAPHLVLGMSPPDCTLVGAQAAECVVLQPGVAQALRAGQVTPLLLASPPGYAIVPKTDNPRRIDQWRVMYQQLGIGPAAQALQARMQGQFILSQHPSTRDYVLDVPFATYTVHCQGQHGKLPIAAICWDDRGRNLDANAPRTFVVNANNSISPTKATHLVFGIRGALPPLAAAQHVAQPTAQSVPVVQSVAVAQPALQLGPPSTHGGTSSANSALGDAYRTGGMPNVPMMGLPVEPAVPTKSCAAASSSSATTPMPPLNQACEEFKRELGVGGANFAEVVDAACEMLGISTKGLSLMEKAQKCWTSIKG